MLQSWPYLQTLGKSVCGISEHVTMKKQSMPQKKIIDSDDEDDSSSDSSNEGSSFTRTSSSPLFYTFFSLISQGNCSRYSRHKSIREEYRNYRSTPTFADRQMVSDLDQTKNKSIEQPSEPKLHPVLLEPRIFKREEYSKLCQKSNSEIASDEDKNKNKNEICRFECPICLCNVKNGDLIVQAKCGHIFHHKCVQPWFVEHHSCPICRAEIESA